MDRKKKWIIRIFTGFFLIMAGCTVLSRAAASVLVAQVTVEKPARGKLSYSYDGSGTVVPVKEDQIFLWQGQQVEWIAGAGSSVKAGECLVQFRMEYLQQTIEQKEAELKQLELQAGQQEISARGTAWVPAAESAARTLAEAQEQLQAAQQKEADVQAAYDRFAGEDGQNAWSGTDGQENGSAESEDDSSAGLQKLESALQEARAEAEAAQQAVRQAQDAYDLAAQQDTAQDINAANAAESAQLGVQALNVQADMVRKELEKLKGYRDAGGTIRAEQDCTVILAGAQPGTVTTGSEILVTGCGGWRLKGLVDGTDKEKLKPGDEADIRLNSGGKKAVRIEAVGAEQNAEGGSTGEQENASGQSARNYWYASVPENVSVKGGESFTWTVETTSEKEYEQTIPLGALREGTDGAYCLVLAEENSMLGTVLKAKRVPVTVLEKDAKKAAVTSSLKDTDRVLVSSEKYVEEGDRVRLKE